jgi:hypothetical protein
VHPSAFAKFGESQALSLLLVYFTGFEYTYIRTYVNINLKISWVKPFPVKRSEVFRRKFFISG